MWRIVCCTFSTVIRGWWWWGGAWVNYGKLAAKLGRFSNQSPPLVPAKGSTPHFKSLPEIIPSTFFLWIFHPNSSKWKGKIKWRKGNSMDPSWSCEPVDAVDLSLLKLIRRSLSRIMGAQVLFLYVTASQSHCGRREGKGGGQNISCGNQSSRELSSSDSSIEMTSGETGRKMKRVGNRGKCSWKNTISYLCLVKRYDKGGLMRLAKY